MGCGGAQLEGQVYRGEETTFRVGPMPESWRRLDLEGPALSFRDETAQATVAVNARCGRERDDVPLKALTQHLFLHFTERQILDQRSVPLDGREALRTELVAALDGVRKHYTVVVLKKDWCVYDFMHIATDASPSESRAAFDRFVQGFATLN